MSAAIEIAFADRLGTFAVDVSFTTPMRGITAVFGPSGSGKTTLLRCIAGLQHLNGRLRVGTETWQDDAAGVFLAPHRRRVGYVFQQPSLFPHLPVRGNLFYGARRAGADGRDIDAELQSTSELLGITHLLDRGTRDLSGGESQRVAVARALLARPELLLMDEPVSSLDVPAREELLKYIETLHRELSIPVIYVSHDVAEVAQLANHIVVLGTGRVLAQGPLAEVFERLDLAPATGRFETGAVLTARVVSHDDRYRLTQLEHGGHRIVIPHVEAAPGEEIRVRIRARDVALSTEHPGGISIRNIFQGGIVEIREEQDTAYAEVLVDIGGTRLRARITRQSVADLALETGKTVFALVKSVSFDRPG